MCHCWVCSIKGKTPYKIIKDHVSVDLAKVFLKQFGDKKRVEDEESESEESVSFPAKFNMLACVTKNNLDPDVRDCLRYLKKRGVTREQLWRHKIGYFSSNRLSRRVVFPSFDSNQKLNFYVTRAIDDDAFLKYKNSKAKKTDIVFDEIRIDWDKEIIIVEGVFDMIKCPNNTTCLLGSSLNQEHMLFQKIVKHKTPVLLGLDSDMKEKTFKIAKMLNSYDIPVRIFQHDSVSDIGSLDKELVRQKCFEAPIYSSESRLLHMIGTINSGSIF
jgi:DNA primase